MYYVFIALALPIFLTGELIHRYYKRPLKTKRMLPLHKFGMAVGIILMGIAFLFYFLIGRNSSDMWPYTMGTLFLIMGMFLIIVVDKSNKVKEKRIRDKQRLNESLETQRADLHEYIAREKESRDEFLKNMRDLHKRH